MSGASDTPLFFRFLIRVLRMVPDFDFCFMKALRHRAVTLLALPPGARVLDVGCGPGGSLPYLREAVGDEGEVVGVEISRAVAAIAERRVARHAWNNVSVVVAPAQTVRVPGMFAGLMMFAAPDVYASPEAWANLRPHLRLNARVVFFGAKTSTRRGGWLLNGLLRRTIPRLSFASTPPRGRSWPHGSTL